MNLFGKPKPKTVAPKLTESIAKLQEASESLEKREKHLQKQVDQCLQEAKLKTKAKDKRGALFLIKRKKLYEKQIEQLYGKRANIDLQIMALQNASSNKEVLGAMKQGAAALKAAVKESDVDKVDDVMGEIQDSMAVADELSEAMSQPIGAAVDEDELNAELAEMENEMMDEQMLAAPSVPVKTVKGADEEKVDRPATVTKTKPATVEVGATGVPTKPAAAAKSTKEDQELRELEALMGM